MDEKIFFIKRLNIDRMMEKCLLYLDDFLFDIIFIEIYSEKKREIRKKKDDNYVEFFSDFENDVYDD